MVEKKYPAQFIDEEKMALCTDLYQLTMSQAYFDAGKADEVVTFDLFFRKNDKRGYYIFGGLEQALHYLENFGFDDESVEYLRSTAMFSEPYLEYLKEMKFEGEVHTIPEGTAVFPEEPVIRITAKRAQAQMVETYLLNQVNFQTMIASKAARVVDAAQGRGVADFSLRRDHSESAALKAARASYIAGCAGTSNVVAAMYFGIRPIGTAAHAFTMSFDSELEAFKAYCKSFPDNAVLLIDTYGTMNGVKNAVKAAKEVLEPIGKRLKGVRLDSGDLCELSKGVRKVLDEAGMEDALIVASDDLDEYRIEDMLADGAQINLFGVGTSMGTSKDSPAMPGVYKLAEDVDAKPKIKVSDGSGKTTLPGKKQVYRIVENNGAGEQYVKDVIALEGEEVEGRPLLQKVMEEGKTVFEQYESLDTIRERALQEVKALPEAVKKIRDHEQYVVEKTAELSGLVEELRAQYGKQEVAKEVEART